MMRVNVGGKSFKVKDGISAPLATKSTNLVPVAAQVAAGVSVATALSVVLINPQIIEAAKFTFESVLL